MSWQPATLSRFVLVLLVTPLCCALQPAQAQDFRVVTTVSQRPLGETDWKNVGRSITLFHAGRIYDYMESIGEVVVVEPAENRLVILSVNGNNLATSLHFSELKRFLKVAAADMEKRLGDLRLENAQNDGRPDALQFQLQPEFNESYDPATRTLSLSSSLLRYEVETASSERPSVVTEYLQYADWAARLNFVLHSGSLYPEPRLALNQSLRERQLLPTEVRLLLDGAVPLQLKAEHKYEWSLGSIDRSMIRRCDQDRTAETTRWVNFRQFQRRHAADTAHR